MAPMWDRPDKLAENDYGMSPYVYCGGNPVNMGDYDGRFSTAISANFDRNLQKLFDWNLVSPQIYETSGWSNEQFQYGYNTAKIENGEIVITSHFNYSEADKRLLKETSKFIGQNIEKAGSIVEDVASAGELSALAGSFFAPEVCLPIAEGFSVGGQIGVAGQALGQLLQGETTKFMSTIANLSVHRFFSKAKSDMLDDNVIDQTGKTTLDITEKAFDYTESLTEGKIRGYYTNKE